VDILWCQGAQNVELSNHKLISALKCIAWSQWTLVSDRQANWQTGEHHGSATIPFNERIAH